ncbi:hypothetical protein pb186bvf_007097 [Paramecium bursaria]
MSHSISTAKFSDNASTSSFDAQQTTIQKLYDDIDEMMINLKKRQPKKTNQRKNQLNMLDEDARSRNLQSYHLAIELEEMQNFLCAQSQTHISQAQLKAAISDYNTKLALSRSQLLQIDSELKQNELKTQELNQKSQNYSQFLQKTREKQQQSDSITKMLSQNGIIQWMRIKQLFDVDSVRVGVPIGNIIRLQLLLLKEIETLIMQRPINQEEKKQLLFEINSTNPLIQSALSFDQMILNVIHQPKDLSIPRQGILLQIQKCLNNLHQNFCVLAQNLNKNNFSQRLFDENQKELLLISNSFKQLQQTKSQIILDGDKCKRKVKEAQTQLQQMGLQTEQDIEQESLNLLQMYLKDKEILMRDIKFKYGKAYHDHMISDVKQEFKNICIEQQISLTKKIEQYFIRIQDIKQILAKGKERLEDLNYEKQKLSQQTIQDIEVVDKKEYMLQLQNIKINLLQLENKINKKQEPEHDQKLQQLQIQIKQLQFDIDNNFIVTKQRSDSIDTVKKHITAPIHQRCQSQVPAISIQLIDIPIQNAKIIDLQISNPQEILESQEDPIQNVKKPHEWSSYQLSFNQNPLKSISNISGQVEQSFITQKESSVKGSILDMIQNTCKTTLNLMIFLQLKQSNRCYDPILNYNDDPHQFGYEIIRLDDQLNVYTSIDKENLNSYTKLISQLNVKQFLLDHCSENAIKFQKIYEPSIRQICQDSLALRHLNVKYYPFQLIGTQNYKGLAFNDMDLVKLDQYFKN